LNVYEGLLEDMSEAAAKEIQLHLKKLDKEGRVKSLGRESKDERWVLVQYAVSVHLEHPREL
jgi:hypothetical protein